MIIRPWDGFLPLELPAIGSSFTTGGPMATATQIPDEKVGEDVSPVLTEFVLTGANNETARAAVLTEDHIQLIQSLLFREQDRLGQQLGPSYTESDDELLNLDADTYHEVIAIRKVLLAVYGTDDAIN